MGGGKYGDLYSMADSVCMMLKTLSMEGKMPVGVGIWRM